ncbi:hypothetical protein CEXT_270681 [Caerostris extrusa]|uniref:Uncharacterized protein n=1 Tax=Caerostris extrusa TaxID=172846 RepID=A0AAV4R929_CAEEX|nr:hypothetical protein CEXT_270681 [Caerostris extrusa]
MAAFPDRAVYEASVIHDNHSRPAILTENEQMIPEKCVLPSYRKYPTKNLSSPYGLHYSMTEIELVRVVVLL